MVMCFVPDCNHYSERDECKFFRFPKDEVVRKTWIKNVRRADRLPSNNSRVCSCHFKDGNKDNKPTIFKRNEDKIMMYESPAKRPCRRFSPKKVDDVSLPTEVICSTANESIRSVEVDNLIQSYDLYQLKKENYELKETISKLENNSFGYRFVKDKSKMLKYYSGIKKDEFEIILKACTKSPINYYSGWQVKKLPHEDQLLLTLMKMKLNLGHLDLAFRFNVSTAVVTNTFLTWIHVLHEVIFKQLMTEIPSRNKNQTSLPSCFDNFTNCRMVLDCTEISTNVPKRMDHQKLFYSNYKHRNTMKSLIAVAPNGVITYVSDLYPGSTSDKEIFKQSEIYNLLQTGDLILADKGFLITDLVPPGVTVNIPPFLFAPQFTPSEIHETTSIARARIHVERAIRRIKVYQITKLIPKSLFPFATKIFQVCVALTNFQEPLLNEVKESFL